MAGFVLAIMMLLSLAPAALAEEAPQGLGLTGAALVSEGLSVDAVVDADTVRAEVAGASQQLVLQGVFDAAVVQAADGTAMDYDPAAGLELALAPGENLFTVTLAGGEEQRAYTLSLMCQAEEAAAPEADEAQAEAAAEDGEEIELETAATAFKLDELYLTKGLFSWHDWDNAVSSEIKAFNGYATQTDVTGLRAYETTVMTTSWARPHLLIYSSVDTAGHRLELMNKKDTSKVISWGRISPYMDNLTGANSSYAGYVSVPLDLEKGLNEFILTEHNTTSEKVYHIKIKLTSNPGTLVEPTGFVLGQESMAVPNNYKAFIGFAPTPDGSTLPVEDLRWTSSDDSIATVSSSGYVITSATKTGTVTITAKHKDKTGEAWEQTCRVTVGGQVKTIDLQPNVAAITTGEIISLYASTDPAETGFTPIWTVENSRVAKIVSTGTDLAGESTYHYADVRGVGAGVTKVSVSIGGKTTSSQITVNRYTPPKGMSIGSYASSIPTGGSTTLKSSLYNSNDPALNLQWKIVQGASLATIEPAEHDKQTTYMKLTAGDKPGAVVVRHWSATYPELWAEARIDIISDLTGATTTDLAPARLEASSVTVNAGGNAKAPFAVSRGTPTGKLQYTFGKTGNTFLIVPVNEDVEKDKTAAQAADDLFTVTCQDEGTLNIAFKNILDDAAIKKLAKSYTVALKMKIAGTDLVVPFTGALTIKVNKKLPTIKGQPLAFNTFFDSASSLYKSVDIAGLTLSTLTDIPTRNTGLKNYFTFLPSSDKGTNIVTPTVGTKKSGTMYFSAKFAEYGDRVFTVPVKVSTCYAAPGVKQGASSLTVPINMSGNAVDGMVATLKPKSGKDTLLGLEVKSIAVVSKADAAAQVKKGKNPYTQQENLYQILENGKVNLATGEFRVKTINDKTHGYPMNAASTTLLLEVSFKDTSNKLYLPLAIKAKHIYKPTLTFSAKSLTLNTAIPGGDPATIAISSNLSYPSQPFYSYTITKGGKVLPRHQWPISVEQDGWNLNIAATSRAQKGASYKLKVTSGYSISFSVTVKIAKTEAVVLTGTPKGALNLATRAEAAINMKLSGYQGKLVGIKPGSLVVTDAKTRKEVEHIDKKLDLSLGGATGMTVSMALADELYAAGSTYKLNAGSYYITTDLTFISETGHEVKLSKPVKFSVKTSKPKTAAAAPIKDVTVSGSLSKTFKAEYLGDGTNCVALSYASADAAKAAKGTKTVTLEITLYGGDNVKTTAKVKIAAK